MTTITIGYDYDDITNTDEVIELLVLLGKQGYLITNKPEKGKIILKKEQQKGINLYELNKESNDLMIRMANSAKKITEDTIISMKCTTSVAPALPVHRVGDEYIVAYTDFAAIQFVANRDERHYVDVKKTYKSECTPLKNHAALLDIEEIDSRFWELITEEFSSSLYKKWINEGFFYQLGFDFILKYVKYDKPFRLAYIQEINGLQRVFYNHCIAERVEEYLREEGK